jgi:predicted N-acyltransferase
MNKNEPTLTFSIIRKISAIPRQEWNNLFGADLIESYGYQKTLEENGVENFSFGYLLAKRGERVVLILPFFILNFSLSMLMPDLLRKLIGKFDRRLKMNILFPGSPTTEGFSMGLSRGEEPDIILDQALGELRDFCEKEKMAGIVFYNLSSKHLKLADYLKRRKFIKMETLPTSAITLKAGSLEEYIKGLSKNTRKDLNKKLRRSGELAELKTETRTDVTDIIDRIYELYLNNFNDADIHFETLTKDFFLNICRNMPGVAKYFITYDKDKIAAFNLCLIKNGVFIDKFIGFDRDLAHKLHLYYTSFCHNIDWCVKNKLHTCQLGFSDYHPKVRLGAKLIPLYVYAKPFNPILKAIIKLARPLIEPKNMDSDLKEIIRLKGKTNLLA